MKNEEEQKVNEGVGLGILLATLLAATVICSVGFAVEWAESSQIRNPTKEERLENDVKWIKEEMRFNWMPHLKDLSKDVAELKRLHKELEVENSALRRDQRLSAAGE